MTEHYYSAKPSVGSRPRVWKTNLRGKAFQFQSDAGVFSKAEVDFGSRLLIESLVIEGNASVLDVGCGYGPIGIAVAKENPDAVVHMVDINERAINLAKQNAALNHVSNVQIYQSNLFENITECNFAHVISNPPIRAGKKVVHQLFEVAHERLVVGGALWIVIQKKQGAPSAIAKLEAVFSHVEVVAKKSGYFIIKAAK